MVGFPFLKGYKVAAAGGKGLLNALLQRKSCILTCDHLLLQVFATPNRTLCVGGAVSDPSISKRRPAVLADTQRLKSESVRFFIGSLQPFLLIRSS